MMRNSLSLLNYPLAVGRGVLITLLLAALVNPLPALANRGGGRGNLGGALNRERNLSNRVNRNNLWNLEGNANINRNVIRNRNNRPNSIRNIDRTNLNIDRRNRNWNNINVDRRNRNWNNVNINNRSWRNNRWNNNNIIVNPRWRPGWNHWWWNGNRPWYPTPRYWGGGFWGNLAIGLSSAAVAGAVAGSIANANNNPQVVVVNNSPGGQLLSSYELVQVPCSTSANLVVIAGPSDSVICARPTAAVPAGFYTVDTANLALIPDV
ncbi:hypothetical protein BRW62_11855 [Parathermosynechococcus lividus PCC 6715]|jgi:hypothetical protein|uniref:Uncharacterized protein n=1 Tax=Parathermosynechococcus lividus PCC 6715 TaxID=1917166 RepID=A0A2D2Q475_PARLV|nr:hypothetical protein [Thermostichus lividus]ATS19308.1 hypothetical protein BRW62_11855 [Thermostichus lividus PCC 6715]